MPELRRQSALLRCLAASVAFLLPTGVALLGRYVDRSTFRADATYKALIPWLVFGSLVLAVTVPAVLVMSARMHLAYRVLITIGVWLLLAVELYWLFFVVVVAR